MWHAPVLRETERPDHDASFVVDNELTKHTPELRQATRAQVHCLKAPRSETGATPGRRKTKGSTKRKQPP